MDSDDEDVYGGYMSVPTFDIDDALSDSNKHESLPWEDQRGLTVSSGSVTLKKDSQNLIGISIGGGAPQCPCLYVVQIFDNTPASKDGTLVSGDEIVGVNGSSVKGRTKGEVARMIQRTKTEAIINYNKLHADPQQGKCLDIVLKKVKHRVVENMSSGAADALGLSRAILCNDGLVRKLQELEKTADMYRGMMEHAKALLKAFLDLSQAHKEFGEVFAAIGVREHQPNASEAFTYFGEVHRAIERFAIKMLKKVKPMISDLNTYLDKAVPDTRLTIKKYLDAKFEYLSYCLKVKEMDDEEASYAAFQEPLYRVETGNYEYRLVLYCRQDARKRFASMRSDVLVKMELLDQKHVQDIVFQLQRLVSAMAHYHNDCHGVLKEADVFPIEVNLSCSAFTFEQTMYNGEEDEEPEEDDAASNQAAVTPDDDDDDVDLISTDGVYANSTDDVDLISTAGVYANSTDDVDPISMD